MNIDNNKQKRTKEMQREGIQSEATENIKIIKKIFF